MKPGDKVKVKRLRQVSQAAELVTIEEQKAGTVVAVLDAQSLYPHAPKYTKAYTGKRRENKYDPSDKIVQVQLDGEHCARNFPAKEVALA